MNKFVRRLIWGVLFAVTLLFIYAFLYRWGMRIYEGENVGFVGSLQIVVEAVTTAGFGGDAPWESRLMQGFVILMNLTGVGLMFLAVPLFVVPLLQQAFEPTLPRTSDLSDHIIICGFTSREMVILDEEVFLDRPLLFLSEDRELLRDLEERGESVMYGDPTELDVLKKSGVRRASTLVADLDDELNAVVILSALELNENLEIISIIEDLNVESHHYYAGAHTVIHPRQSLGKSLALKAEDPFTRELRDRLTLGENLEVAEMLVHEGSELVEEQIRYIDLLEDWDLHILGLWEKGHFISAPDPDYRLNTSTILLVSGTHDSLQKLKTRAISPERRTSGHVLIAGYGEVGETVEEELNRLGLESTTLDTEDREGVDIVADISEEQTFEDLDLKRYEMVVLAVDRDITAMYATLLIDRYGEDLEVLVRAGKKVNVPTLYRAGADYVVALSEVAGRMLLNVLEPDKESLSPATSFEMVKTGPGDLVGRTIGDVDIRARTGASIVAIERDDTMLHPGPDHQMMDGDRLIVAGNEESVQAFEALTRGKDPELRRD